jgi:hypothetical protein
MGNPQDPDQRAGASAAVPEAVVALLGATRPWVKLISVLAFVGTGLGMVAMLIGGLATRRQMHGSTSLSFLAFLPLMLLYVPPAVFLWRYAQGIEGLQGGGGHAALEFALRSQKSFWKYLGISCLVMLVVYGVAMGVGFLVGFSRHVPG